MQFTVLSSLLIFSLSNAAAGASAQIRLAEVAPSLAESSIESQLLNRSLLVSAEQLMGLWEPRNPPDERSPLLWFTDDGRAFFISPNPEENQAIEMDYRLNLKTSPAELDIILTGGSSLKGIIELRSSDELRLDGAVVSSDPRPQAFSKNAVDFKRLSQDGTLPDEMNVLTLEDIEQIQQRKPGAN